MGDLHELPGKYKSTLDQRRCPASTSATTTGTSRSTRRASRSPRPHPPVLPSSVVSTMAAWSSQQIHEQPQVPLWPTRTAKAPLHLPSDLVRRRRYRSRHRVHHRPHLFQPRASLSLHWPQAPSCHCDDDAEATPLPIPGTHWRLPCCSRL